MSAKVGFVVIGRNEGERLKKCLQSLKQFGGPIVYADSDSDDGSAGVAREMGAIAVPLDPAKPLNASRGRREGYLVLKSLAPDLKYVHFIDGDCVLAEGWLTTAQEFLDSHPEAAIACGRRYEAHPEASFYNRLCDEEWNTPVGRANASGGDALVRATAYDEVGGFDPTLMASEEPELAARLRAQGWEIWRLDHAMTEHDAQIFTFRAYWRRSLRAGFGYVQAWRRSRRSGNAVNARLLGSNVTWTLLLPITVFLAALITGSVWVLVLLPFAYFLQMVRIAVRRGAQDWHNWKAAAVLMAIKFAETLGAAKGLRGDGTRSAWEYKGK